MKKAETKDDPDRDLLLLAINLAAAAFLIATVAFATYLYKFGRLGFSSDQSQWGEFGDFLGGVINPVVGIVTVFLLLITVILQRKELRNSIEEMRKSNAAFGIQNFEQTFFTWLEMYQRQVREIKVADAVTVHSGIHAMQWLYECHLNREHLRGALKKEFVNSYIFDILVDDGYKKDMLPYEAKPRCAEEILKRWDVLNRESSYQLETQFRTLSRLIYWVDTNEEQVINQEKKWFYISLIRSQLSRYELMFYLLLMAGNNGRKYRKTANKYALFDNLEFGDNDLLEILKDLDIYEGRAFSSESARVELGLSRKIDDLSRSIQPLSSQ